MNLTGVLFAMVFEWTLHYFFTSIFEKKIERREIMFFTEISHVSTTNIVNVLKSYIIVHKIVFIFSNLKKSTFYSSIVFFLPVTSS